MTKNKDKKYTAVHIVVHSSDDGETFHAYQDLPTARMRAVLSILEEGLFESQEMSEERRKRFLKFMKEERFMSAWEEWQAYQDEVGNWAVVVMTMDNETEEKAPSLLADIKEKMAEILSEEGDDAR